MNDLRKIADAVAKRIIARAVEDEQKRKKAELPEGVGLDDFLAYLPQHNYIFRPTGQLWPAASINGRLPWMGGVRPSKWLDSNNAVEQMTWAPGEPTLIDDKLIADGGWIERKGARVFNLYRPSNLVPGNAANAQPWVDHVHKIYPDEAEHIIKWLAHRCQFPAVKINHALVLGGSQGIGKDTLLEPVRRTVGYWNCASVSPTQLLSRFNSFLKSLLLVVSEARDLGEINRPNFYEHTKVMIAAPPETVLIDEKNTHPYYIPNLTSIVITTNHKTSGIYLPPDDRRHFVAWSPLELEAFDETYWSHIWGFYDNGGFADVAAYLLSLDVSEFNAKKDPPRTQSFYEIVTTSMAPEIPELDDALRNMGYPAAVTIDKIIGITGGAEAEFAIWARDRRNRRMLPRWMEQCGYILVRNPSSKQGLWSVSGRQQMIYARSNLPSQQRTEAANSLARGY